MPFDAYDENTDSLSLIESYLNNTSSGVDLPAAIIVETIQGEGGINAASEEWLRGIEKIARKFEILLIVDDIQAGCGRTGTFFSFERAGITPDIVCLSKSIGGYGLPMAITLFNKELDIWGPGEHNGTFRGNNLAFIAATEALTYWENDTFSNEIDKKAALIENFTTEMVQKYPEIKGETRGRGLMQGVACHVDGVAEKICAASFEQGLLMETSGPKDEVFKFLPPLMIDEEGLKKGFQIIENSIQSIVEEL
ncbi:MAG TPA: aminotransferase class III-fold pyridoxal phosphate-dependent enzyme, partial [Candidatus Pseudogracilibacillus intestinigallinarum]|nr:aminotransferase class III-fold pyridoxal phosphate-dependent enzyme [Candidatus Pseudogracilibacillus intestinigallinarum]